MKASQITPGMSDYETLMRTTEQYIRDLSRVERERDALKGAVRRMYDAGFWCQKYQRARELAMDHARERTTATAERDEWKARAQRAEAYEVDPQYVESLEVRVKDLQAERDVALRRVSELEEVVKEANVEHWEAWEIRQKLETERDLYRIHFQAEREAALRFEAERDGVRELFRFLARSWRQN